jgi:hypothetical protein
LTVQKKASVYRDSVDRGLVVIAVSETSSTTLTAMIYAPFPGDMSTHPQYVLQQPAGRGQRMSS